MFNTLLVQPLFNVLAIIYSLVGDFGLAVIIFTILVRLALWPLINKQLHSQRAIQQLAPEVAKIREKAKGDKQKEAAMTMELYKERKINPFAGFLPLLIQLPLLFALFIVLKDIVEPGKIAKLAYEGVRELGPIKAIIENQASFNPTLFGVINLAKPSILLALAAATTQFFQTRQLMPKDMSHMAPETASINRMTLYMFPALTFFFSFGLPAALPLYWTVTSLVAMLQQHLVLRRDVVEMEQTRAPKQIQAGDKGKAK